MTKTNNQQEILSDLKSFLIGVTTFSNFSSNQSSKSQRNETFDTGQLVKTATSLIKNLPASREAVLFFFCNTLDESITRHLALKAQNQANTEVTNKKHRLTDDQVEVGTIYDCLSSLIKWNPKGWAPIISTWSLRILGQMSSFHSQKLQLTHAEVGLNDTLQVWLACPAMRMLIDLTTQCLEGLTQLETDACINALLETSVEYSPHFDWVVAHIGGCFPHTVVTRVLSCGLQDFVSYGMDQSSAISPKLHSVVGILAHLSSSHTTNIQKAVSDLFMWSCSDTTEQHNAVVPYFLRLSSLSLDLLDIIVGQVVKCIATNDKILQNLVKQGPAWSTKYFNNQEALITLTVQQLIRCRHGGFELIKLLLMFGSTNSHDSDVCTRVGCELLEMLLTEAALIIQNSGRVMSADVSLLQSLSGHLTALCHLLLQTSNSWMQGALLRLLTLMAAQQGPGVSNHVLTLLLQKSDSSVVVPLIRRYLQSPVQGLHPQAVQASVHEVLKFQGRNVENALHNLLELVALESVEPASSGSYKYRFQAALNCNLELFADLLFQDGQAAHLAVRLLNSIRLPEVIPPRLVAKLAYGCVPHFFTVLYLGGRGKEEVEKILATLSAFPNGQSLVLRLLMQGIFCQEWKALFGAKSNQTAKLGLKKNQRGTNFSLLEQNLHFCSSVTLPQRHSSVFHAGIIGNGIRHPPTLRETPTHPTGVVSEDIRSNINVLIDTLSRCCSLNGNSNGMTQLSLLLVEIVSPDVMFNGLPWPDEEFTKVTVERDLQIRRFVEDHTVVWDLLNLFAQNRPSLCYCSVLLRALLATLLSHWANCQERHARDSSNALMQTCRLLELMAIGQLLPPPLSYLSEIMAHISPHEVHVLLKDIWAFMRDNVPAPSLFPAVDRGLSGGQSGRDLSSYKIDPRYTERLRLIMLANISGVGHLYPRFLAPA